MVDNVYNMVKINIANLMEIFIKLAFIYCSRCGKLLLAKEQKKLKFGKNMQRIGTRYMKHFYHETFSFFISKLFLAQADTEKQINDKVQDTRLKIVETKTASNERIHAKQKEHELALAEKFLKHGKDPSRLLEAQSSNAVTEY